MDCIGLPGAGVQPRVDGHGPTHGLGEVQAVLISDAGVLEVEAGHVAVHSE